MNSQQLLFINLLIVAIVAVLFLAKRLKHKQPSTATVERIWAPPVNNEILEAAVIEPVPPEAEIPPPIAPIDPEATPVPKSKTKRERIYFVYNGHEWDAFEVLGLVSGVGLDVATRHYQELIKTSDPSTFEFYDAAFSSFLKLRNSISKTSVE